MAPVRAWMMAAALVGAGMQAGCAPEVPVAPVSGYQLVPRAASARLAEPSESPDPGAGSLSARQWVSLGRLAAQVEAAGARRAAFHLAGPLTPAQRVSIGRWLRQRLPDATLSFSDGGGALVARVEYLEVASGRCRPETPWIGEDGLLPAGCAVELTFARQVANPNDLIAPQPLGPALMEPLARDALRYSQGDEGKSATAAKAQAVDGLSSAATAGAAGK